MGTPLLKDPSMHFGAQTFFARQHKEDVCGSNGLPLTPNSIIIYGRAQALKTVRGPRLCRYLDFIRGKHERMVVVSQYCGEPLSGHIGYGKIGAIEVSKIGYQVLTGLDQLHERGIIHRNLSCDNILVQNDAYDIKLFNYGTFYATDNGRLVSFPIVQPSYTAPEVYLATGGASLPDPRSDVWSLGIVLAELALDIRLWASLGLAQRVRKVLSLLQSDGAVFERIAREHGLHDSYEALPVGLRGLVEKCLGPRRPTSAELLDDEVFDGFREEKDDSGIGDVREFEAFTIEELYHWWRLAGGDVMHELRRQGLVRSSPPVLSLPHLVLIEGVVLGQDRNPATLYDPRVVQMPLDALYERLRNVPFDAYYPLVQIRSEVLERSAPKPYDATGLPLVIKERDPEYQFHRVILLRRLLHGYPFTRELIAAEARKDIPPLLRGEIWAALLRIRGDYAGEYVRIDKHTPTATDRQIEVDIPRCHQYNELLSSAEGHRKLKRILKAWVYKNSQYVYWQGLDSLTAPFLYLNFNDEAKAFACLSAFVPKYLHKFFLRDNSAVIEEYLAKFSQLISFHDPRLANHLHDINFYPQLFAIPWFLTLFSHVFPLYKILHLWDKVLLADSSYSLHIGLSVLSQLRERLLSSGFNECILLFSDLPEVDIERSVDLSTGTYDRTPKSITARRHENEEFRTNTEFDIRDVSLDTLKRERCPRISASDVADLIRYDADKVLLVDIRNLIEYSRCCFVGSLNVPFSSVPFGENRLENLGQHGSTLKDASDRLVVVVGNEETDMEPFPTFLLRCNVARVCVLHGGFETLARAAPSAVVHSNHHDNQ